MQEKIIIHPLLATDIDFLKEMFYESLYTHDDELPLPKSIINQPELKKYYHNWDLPNDISFIAKIENTNIGVVWCRFFTNDKPGYGFIDEQTPELGIAIKSTFRGKRIGTLLMNNLFEVLHTKSIKQISLSVDSRNRAFYLYQNLGFKTIKTENYTKLMVKHLF